MHTTQTTHHRVFFSNVNNRALLNDLTSIIGMEATEDENVFDLIQSEDESTVVADALFDTFPERLLPVGCRDAYDMTFGEIIVAFKKLAATEEIAMISNVFESSRYETGANDTDIDCDELFDILSVLGNTHFTVDGIYTQWAMHSDKNQFGAHAGGAQVTTKHFTVPCRVSPDKAMDVIKVMVNNQPRQMGDCFVKEFIGPVVEGIRDSFLRNSIEAAFARYMRIPTITPGNLHDMLTAYNTKPFVTYRETPRDAMFASNIGQARVMSGCLTDDEEIWATWNGIHEEDIVSGKVNPPSDLDAQVAAINAKLDRADELSKSFINTGSSWGELLFMIHQDLCSTDRHDVALPGAGHIDEIAARVESLLMRRKDLPVRKE